MPVGNHQVYDQDNLEIIGNHNIVKGRNCIVVGNHNLVHGYGCQVTGNHNIVDGINCRVTGNHNKTHHTCQAEGNFNVGLGWSGLDTMFHQFGGIGQQINFGTTNSRHEFRLGNRTLIIQNIPKETWRDNCKFLWGENQLSINGEIRFNGELVDLDRLLRGDRTVMTWFDLVNFLEENSEISDKPRFEGQDQQTDDESRACVICMDNLKCCAIMPCGHVCLCIACANQFRSDVCPICRAKVKQVNRIFI